MNWCVVDERPNIIPIPQTSPTFKKEQDFSFNQEYSLKQNMFDPSKSSPPNSFMEKLHMRLGMFELTNNSQK
jgi:hypothetical protein